MTPQPVMLEVQKFNPFSSGSLGALPFSELMGSHVFGYGVGLAAALGRKSA